MKLKRKKFTCEKGRARRAACYLLDGGNGKGGFRRRCSAM